MSKNGGALKIIIFEETTIEHVRGFGKLFENMSWEHFLKIIVGNYLKTVSE